MLQNMLKHIFNKNIIIEADPSLNKKIKDAVKDIFLPLDHTLAPSIMNKIEENKNYKKNHVYKFNHKIAPVAISILLVFATIGVYIGSSSFSSKNNFFDRTAVLKNTENPEFNISKESPPSKKSISPSITDTTKTSEIKKKSKIKIFFENIIIYIKNMFKE